MLTSSILLVGLAITGQGEKKWEVVVNREGNFTVEMPEKPDHTATKVSRGPNGRISVTEIICDTPNGVFLVARLEDPVIIPKKVEQQYLDFTRDMYAAKFNGKVTSDKKVQLESSAGRDFTIRAVDPKEGVVTIRAREYLQGRAIFLLLCASMPKRDLPEEAARFLGSFAFGLHPNGTMVKADRRETEAVGKELAGWGMAIDPDGDVKFTRSGKSLTLEIPGTLHDLVADIGKFNAPRILREVDGDFAGLVKVDGSFKPAAPSTKEKTYPLNAAGLVLWKDSENYIFIMRTAMLGKGGKLNSAILFEEREAGHRGAMHNQVVPAGPIMLRLDRKGARIVGGVSSDGVNWKPLKPMDTSWASGPVKVGLLSTNTSSQASVVTFENYSLKTK